MNFVNYLLLNVINRHMCIFSLNILITIEDAAYLLELQKALKTMNYKQEI